MSDAGQRKNRVKLFRQRHGWSQEELAQRAGISRAAVSAIEVERLVPSVAAALALASVLGCRVEQLFGEGSTEQTPTWSWAPPREPCRFWHARVRERLLYFPVETTVAGVLPHDGVFEDGTWKRRSDVSPDNTLVMASCDPAAGLLVNEFARKSKFRLLVLQRSSRQALELMRGGLVDVAGIHLAGSKQAGGNAAIVETELGSGYSLLRAADWQEGLAFGADVTTRSVQALLRADLRWVGRESGSGARQCQDELLNQKPSPRRVALDHRGVADAIRCGWADVGVCVRLVSEEAGLHFLKVRDEAYDLCFPTELEDDPRVRTLIDLVRSSEFRQLLSELPGYDCKAGGDVVRVE